MLTKAPRGTQDFYGDNILLIQKIEEIIRQTTKTFGILELRTPTFEHTELFARGVGDTTDIVEKEMYTLTDKADRSLTLKPEGTAGAVRAFIQNKLYANPQPTKLYYMTSCFRYEKPQAGRFREFHQLGIEYFGSYEANADVEVISFADTLLKKLGIKNIKLEINSLGGRSCREKYNNTMKTFLQNNLENLCDTCRDRFERNPLRILDCKNSNCQIILKDAPSVIDSLDIECKKHFEDVKAGLTALKIEFKVNSKIVRGLDYYTRTVFEFSSNDIGAQSAVCAGGRYDNLIEEFDGPPTGAVGFGLGIERITNVILEQKSMEIEKSSVDLYIGSIGENANLLSMEIANNLRFNSISVATDLLKKSVKAQMKYADNINSKFSCIIGDDEILKGIITIKNMEDGTKTEVVIKNIIDFFGGH